MSKGQIRDEKTSQTITMIGVMDENFNVSNVISDLVMPYKINVTKQNRESTEGYSKSIVR